MSSKISEPRFKLYYWPLPFRGCFVSYLFAYRDVPLLEIADFEEISDLQISHPSDQDVPFMGPPVLSDLESGRSLSQMPAIVLYVAGELDLIPEDPFDAAMCMKVLMDCNDVLMEICRYNGSIMWERDTWTEFRSNRLPRWLDIFEESLKRGLFGRDAVSFADIGVYALFGNMIRCLPELEPDLRTRAPGTHAICQRIGSKPSLAKFVADEEREYGNLYCGGQIEQSIRRMLEEDAADQKQ
ncbi:MAG: glutathione S-transferase family protein [Woeseiaceae bacterium]|nr:glutathione S-transferase family protein [Woeseiaceae bacterium]